MKSKQLSNYITEEDEELYGDQAEQIAKDRMAEDVRPTGENMSDHEIYVTVRLVAGELELATTTNDVVAGILYPAGGGRIGALVMDSKKHLGIEEQAIPVLQELFEKAGCDGDGFGDINWSKAGDGRCIFGWLGPNTVRWSPATFPEADRSVGARFREGEFQVIDPLAAARGGGNDE